MNLKEILSYHRLVTLITMLNESIQYYNQKYQNFHFPSIPKQNLPTLKPPFPQRTNRIKIKTLNYHTPSTLKIQKTQSLTPTPVQNPGKTDHLFPPDTDPLANHDCPRPRCTVHTNREDGAMESDHSRRRSL